MQDKKWDGKPNKNCPRCGKSYDYKLQLLSGGGCLHDERAVGWDTPDGLRHGDRMQIAKARPGGLGKGEAAVKHDGVIHIVDKGG